MIKKKKQEKIYFKLQQQSNNNLFYINKNCYIIVNKIKTYKILNKITMIYFVLKRKVYIINLIFFIIFYIQSER